MATDHLIFIRILIANSSALSETLDSATSLETSFDENRLDRFEILRSAFNQTFHEW